MPNPRVYFPDGPVLQRGVSFNPVTQPDPMHGPGNIQLFQSLPDPPRQSEEQGIGRSPGQRWAHMPHVEQYNYDSLTNDSWHPGEGANRPERQGWSAPLFFEQSYTQQHVFPVPIIIADPGTQAYSDLTEVPQ